MTLELTFEITLQSNYHVGAGYGLGFGVDAALQRDADGVPTLRGSGLSGLLRDGLYRLAELPPLKERGDADLPKRLFGTAARAKRWRIASARPVGMEKPLPRDAWRPGEDAAQQVQRVRIDPRTRRAQDRKLFSQEEGDARLKFHFTATCSVADDAALDEAALLVAAARYVRQLGRSRRRGLGECVIHLVRVTGVDAPPECEDWLLERFRAAWLEGEPQTQTLSEKVVYPTMLVPTYTGAGVRLRLVARLDEPLIISERAPAGNQFDTRPALPGSALRGALAGLAAQRNDLSDPDIYREFVALFLRGGVVFPTLYLACHHQNHLYPAVPAPLGLLTCEIAPFGHQTEGHGLYVLEATPVKTCRYDSCDGRLEPVNGFLVLRQQAPYSILPGESAELHTRIDPKTNRVTPRDLYGYTALDAGQYLVGEMVCAGETAWTRLQEMTGLEERTSISLRLGKAHRRGYGKVTVWMERCDDKPQTWIQVPLSQRVPSLDKTVTLTLLTNTIIADRWGRQATGFEREWLEQALGLGALKIEVASARVRDIDGFNIQMGLPRWRDRALVSGSMVIIKFLSPPPDWEMRMEDLESNGIGLRRNEGLGRIAFNHPVYQKCHNVTGSAIRLEDSMRLGAVANYDQPVREQRFIQKWKRALNERNLDKCRDSRFVAVARYLSTHADEKYEALIAQLDKFGAPDPLSPDDPVIEAVGGKDEYGSRSKDNFFQKEGKAGMDVVRQALVELAKEEPACWILGVRLLAERIATAAQDKEREGGK
jgi:CRISPR-associated protein Csx10